MLIMASVNSKFVFAVVVVVVVDDGDDDGDDDDGYDNDTLPESINKWKADIRFELGADDWDECRQNCTQEPLE